MVSTFQTVLFDRIIPALHNRQITLTALRDSNSIDEVIRSREGDVDFYVSEINWNLASETIREYGFYNLFDNQIFRSIEHSNVIDLYHGSYKRAPFLSDSELTYGKLSEKGLLELKPHILLIVLMLHPLDLTGVRGNRRYTEERKITLQKLYNQHGVKQQFLEWCRLSIGTRFAKRVESFALNGYEYTRVSLLRMKFALFSAKPRLLKYLTRRVIAKFSPAPHLKGRVISVMGVDGSGKTTLLSELQKFIESYNGSSSKVQYSYMGRQAGHRLPLNWCANMFKRISRSFKQGGESITSGKRTLSKEGIAAKTFNRPIWQFVFPFEYSIRLIEIWYLVLFRRKIVLADRYVDDFSHDNTCSYVLRKIINLFPKPSHVFLILGDTKKFYSRKREYSPDELNEMQEKLLACLKTVYGDRLIILDGNQTSSVVLAQALAALHTS